MTDKDRIGGNAIKVFTKQIVIYFPAHNDSGDYPDRLRFHR